MKEVVEIKVVGKFNKKVLIKETAIIDGKTVVTYAEVKK